MDWCQDRGPELFDMKRPDGGGVQPHVICTPETRLKTDEKFQQAYQGSATPVRFEPREGDFDRCRS
eukprot:2248669-Pyramimonas_sp.AAC.1